MATTNPYASPQVVECESPAEGGIWQDGNLLVMHIDYELPAICVKTGKPAQLSPAVTIRWVQNLLPWNLTFGLPLTWAAFRAVMVVPVAAFFGTLAFTAAFVFVASLFKEESFLLMLLIAVLALTTIVMGFRALSALGKLLHVQKSRGKFLWLSGACPEFLKQLPIWDATKSMAAGN